MRLLLNQKFKWQRRTRWRHTVSCSSSPRSIDDWPESQKNYQFSNWLWPSHTDRSTHTYTDTSTCILGQSLSHPQFHLQLHCIPPWPGQFQARSGPGRRFIMFCNLCPFIVWFSTAFRLVVDQLNMAASSAQLWQSTNLHMTGQMDNWTIGQSDKWTIGRVDTRTRAKVNLRPAAGFQKCISNTRVLVSYAKSRLAVSLSASRSRMTASVKPSAKLYSPIKLTGFILTIRVERNTLSIWFNCTFYLILMALQRVQFVLRTYSLSATQFICYKANLSASFEVILMKLPTGRFTRVGCHSYIVYWVVLFI